MSLHKLILSIDKEGPIHDVTWSPKSNEFGVVYGYMPAKTVIFNAKAKATHTYPLGPRNTILFSPQGRFVAVAGFGNLAGQMDIYDLEKDHEKLCTIEASNASLCEWSYDGSHLLTATTSPRLRVDNGVKIWHIDGKLMYTEDMQELYHVTWRPQPPADITHKDPRKNDSTPHPSALRYLGSVKTPQKSAGAYRPPGARGSSTPLAFKREDEGGAAYVSNGNLSQGLHFGGFGKGRQRDVPGAETVQDTGPASRKTEADDDGLSRAAAKNKKKREARKAKDNAEVVGPVHPSPNARSEPKPPGNTHEPPGQPAAPGTMESPPPTALQDAASPAVNGAATPQEKKIRALLKKLRAIDDLKMRRAGGEKLEGTQIKKMETEDVIKRELDDLGYNE